MGGEHNDDGEERLCPIALNRRMWIPSALLCGCIVALVAALAGGGAQQRGGSRVLDVVSLVCGWAYFFCWSASFYPQVFLNWRRKSVVGLSLDYQLLNIFGYLSYFSFNAALFWSKHVQRKSTEHNGKDSAVRFNDVMFFWACDGADERHTLADFSLLGLSSAATKGEPLSSCRGLKLCSLFCHGWRLPLPRHFNGRKIAFMVWLNVHSLRGQAGDQHLQICTGDAKLVTKSTSGWNVDNVLLDFWGLLSVAQLCIDAWNSSLEEAPAR